MISRRGFLRAAPGIPWGMLGIARAARAAEAGSGQPVFRVATSAALLTDVNENDARAAMRSWADMVSNMVGMHIDYEQYSFATPSRLLELMRTGAVDAVGCTTPDYIPFAAFVDPKLVLVAINAAGEEYVLLVNGKSGIHTVAELRGRPLALYRHPTTCMAIDWVEILLNSLNLGPSERFFGGVTPNPKLSRTVLPVFFGQSDACLVTRNGFETMCELNPQLGTALRTVAASPRYLTSLMGFHRDCEPARKLKFQSALQNLARSATGKQLLAMFQTTGFTGMDASVLRGAVDLVEAAGRIRRRYAGVKG
jgi:phosphonate transport system substrate-binding protein